MRFSRLRHRITFMKPTAASVNSMGEEILQYAHTLTVWAEVTPLTGREYEESQKIRAETTYRVTTRFFKDITNDMRILYNNREFDVVSVLNINERNRELQIICSEVDTNGKQ